MTIETASYDQVSVPSCEVTKTTSDTTGRSIYRVEVSLLELDPVRTTTAEERVRGVVSLNPPTVQARTPNELVRLAVDTCLTAYDETEGFSIDGEVIAYMSMRVGFSVSQALRELGVDI